MLLGIIRDTTNNIEYYIDSEKKDNTTEISFTAVNNGIIKELSKKEIIKLIKTIFSSKLTFKEKYNEYDVYLDETNNKRYFKNGREDLFMFLENNGVSAINCIEKISKKAKTKRYNIIVSALVFDIILSTAALIPFAGDITIRENIDKTVSSIVTLTPEEMVNTIQSSKYLTEEEKNILCNETYYKFLLTHSDSNRYYDIRQNINNINIKYYSDSIYNYADGYVDPLNPNTIFVLKNHEDDNDFFKTIIVHEFIHMTQNHNQYSYIKEASDEIIKNEFYQKDIVAYSECIKRVKVLMEIIGPEPVIDCNYNSSSQSFVSAIKNYLSEEEANELLQLFRTPANIINDPEFDLNDLNTKIDNYLGLMYYNKTGKNINNDGMINSIYQGNAKDRIYFNASLNEYYNDFYKGTSTELIDEIKIEDVVNSNNVEKYEYNTNETVIIDGEEQSHRARKQTTNFFEIPTENRQSINITFKDGTVGYTTYNEETNSWKEVKHYKVLSPYEPSISKKFPEQNLIFTKRNTKELEAMYTKTENIESEAKSI